MCNILWGLYTTYLLYIVITNGFEAIQNIPQASTRFFNVIEGLIGNQLTTLSICYHHDISLLRIAAACPLLQHFYIRLHPDPEQPFEEDGYQLTTNNNTQLLPHLVYLVIDCRFQFSSRVAPLLRQSPNLRILHFTSSTPCDFIPEAIGANDVDFVSIMKICPDIFHLECHFDDFDDYLKLVPDYESISYSKEHKGLRRLVYNDDDYVTSPRSGRVLQLLRHTYLTLTVLKIKQFWCPKYLNSMNTPAWADLASVLLPTLQELSVAFLNKQDMNAVCGFLQQYRFCKKTNLKKVSFRVWSFGFNKPLIAALSTIYSLVLVKFDVLVSFLDNFSLFRLSSNLKTIQIDGRVKLSGNDSEMLNQYTRYITPSVIPNPFPYQMLYVTYTRKF